MRRVSAALAAVAVAAALAATAARADSADLANRVEEDWVLVVDATASPDGPQVNTVMGPTADLSQSIFVLDINYRHSPSYSPGGLQILVYDATGLTRATTLATNPLNLANETVKWTQRMTFSGGTCQYVIPNVTSTTWGTFTDSVVLASFNTTLGSLAGYSPDASAANSGGAWKTQGLKSLTLTQVRYYADSTLLWTDTTARPVDCTKPFNRP